MVFRFCESITAKPARLDYVALGFIALSSHQDDFWIIGNVERRVVVDGHGSHDLSHSVLLFVVHAAHDDDGDAQCNVSNEFHDSPLT